MDNFGNRNYLAERWTQVNWEKVGEYAFTILYTLIWFGLLYWYWTGEKEQTARYDLMVFYVLLPLMTVCLSFYYGITKNFGIFRWVMIVFFAVMYLMMDYFTYELTSILKSHVLVIPDWHIMIKPALFSAGGMLVGSILRWFMLYKRKKELERQLDE